MKSPNDRVLGPVRPNLGIEAMLRKCLRKMVEAMHKDVLATVSASYEDEVPLAEDKIHIAHVDDPPSRVFPFVAQDALPAKELQKVVDELVRKWQRRFDDAAPRLAKYFSQSVHARSDTVLKKILKDAGLTVSFRMSRAVQDALAATIAQQVGLIKSIPTQYLQQVQGSVMRSVAAGRDLKRLTEELQQSYGVTRKRAELIARDQNNKATATITRTRQVELGITEAIWVHSGGGKEPRPTHVKAGRDQVRYDVTKGWYDPHEKKHIFPGELINCRCVSKSVIPGFV